MSGEIGKSLKSKLIDVWKDPVWSKIISVVLIGAFAGVWATVRGKWHVIGITLWSWIVAAWTWLGSVTDVWNWLLCALSAIALGVGYVVIRVALEARRIQAAPATPKDYLSDLFESLRWYWSYDYFNRISNLYPCCPDCLLQLEPRYDGSNFSSTRHHYFCEHCKEVKASFKERHEDLAERIQRFIQQKLRNGDWRKVVVTQRSND